MIDVEKDNFSSVIFIESNFSTSIIIMFFAFKKLFNACLFIFMGLKNLKKNRERLMFTVKSIFNQPLVGRRCRNFRKIGGVFEFSYEVVILRIHNLDIRIALSSI